MSSPILVIGAGPSGLAAALTLAQNGPGVPVRIVDKVTTHHTSSRGSGIQTAKKFDSGIQDLRSYKLPGGTEVTKQWKIFGKPIETSPERPYDVLVLSQYHTEAVLRDALAKLCVHVKLRTEPVSMEQDTDGITVTIKKTDEVGGETTEQIRVPYIVGSDGARGITRKAMGATFEGQTKNEDGQVWADAVIEGLDHDFWHIWSIPEKFGPISARPTFNAQALHIGVIGQNFDPKDLLSTGRTASPKMRMVNKFSEGRIFITGVAAHVHSPSGGQACLNTSLNLGWKLALAYTGKGLAAPDLLASYQTERLPVVTHMLITTSNLYNNMVPRKAEDANPDDLQQAVKPDSEDGATKSDYAQWRLNNPSVYDVRGTLGLSDEEMKARAYEGYPDGDVRAGDRAPTAPELVDAAGGETTLFDIFKPWRHTVLVFTPGTEEAGAKVASVIAALQAFPAGTVKTVVLGRHAVPKAVEGAEVYHDTTGRASRAYYVDSVTVTAVAVRPDGYVGAFVPMRMSSRNTSRRCFAVGRSLLCPNQL
ncbi:hypothetical protein V8D89_012441 [Ganoderma adspersum]